MTSSNRTHPPEKMCMNSDAFKRARRYFSYFYKVELKLSVVDRALVEVSFNFSDDYPEGY